MKLFEKGNHDYLFYFQGGCDMQKRQSDISMNSLKFYRRLKEEKEKFKQGME